MCCVALCHATIAFLGHAFLGILCFLSVCVSWLGVLCSSYAHSIVVVAVVVVAIQDGYRIVEVPSEKDKDIPKHYLRYTPDPTTK